MYQSHWGLQETPFRSCVDPRFFHEGPNQEEALARLHFLVDQGRRLGLLMGPAGSGKSLLLEVFANRIRGSGQPVAKVDLLGTDPAELLWRLAAAFGSNPDARSSLASLWRRVTDRISEHRYQQLQTVVLLDDVDAATTAVLEQISRLARYDASPQSRLTIALAGQQQRMGRLGAALLELAELRIDLEPWEQGDTESFLRTSLARAGREAPVFSQKAVARLQELTCGVPRRVSQLADLALVAGAGRQLEQIDAETIESVYHELGVIEV